MESTCGRAQYDHQLSFDSGTAQGLGALGLIVTRERPRRKLDAAATNRINRVVGVLGLAVGVAILLFGGYSIHHNHLDEFLAKPAVADGQVVENERVDNCLSARVPSGHFVPRDCSIHGPQRADRSASRLGELQPAGLLRGAECKKQSTTPKTHKRR